ncbi:MAG: hypothetical protein ACTSSF_00125 [Candidatus Heimdallarchaeaceae archaeon]
MKEKLCKLIWQCPNCGKIYTFGHWPEGEELKIIFSCPNKKNISDNAINFNCSECGWKFRIWMEKEEVEY